MAKQTHIAFVSSKKEGKGMPKATKAFLVVHVHSSYLILEGGHVGFVGMISI